MSLSADEAELIRLILAGSDDALLVYCDLLQHAGDPRGELVIMQLELERHPGDEELARRIRALLDDHEPQWLRYWHGQVDAWDFRRGFLSHLTVPLDRFLATGHDILAIEPLSPDLVHLRSIELQPPRDGGEVEAYIPRLTALLGSCQLERLAIRFPLARDDAHALAASDALANVHTLRMTGWPVTSPILVALLASRHLDRLRTLELPDAGVTDQLALDLAAARRFPQLRRLDLGTHRWPFRNDITLEGASPLVVANPRLDYLDLRNARLGNELLSTLARNAAALRHLDLGGARIDSDNAGAFTQMPLLELLDVRHTDLDNAAIPALAALRKLATLNLAHTNVSARGMQELLRLAPPALRDLTITVSDLADGLVLQLAHRFALHRWR